MIPRFGSIGAASATALSFFSIWFIRLSHSRKKVLHIEIDLLANIISYCLLLVECILSLSDEFYYFLIEAAILIVIVLINMRNIVPTIKLIILKLKKREKEL